MTSVYGLVYALDTVPTVEPGEGPGSPPLATGACRPSPLPSREVGLRNSSNPLAWDDLPAFVIVEPLLLRQEMLVDLDGRNGIQGGFLSREDERECQFPFA